MQNNFVVTLLLLEAVVEVVVVVIVAIAVVVNNYFNCIIVNFYKTISKHATKLFSFVKCAILN